MKKLALVGAAAMLLSLGLFGCNNTEEGVSKDASANGQKMASAANDATTAAKITADKAAFETKQAATEAADATKKAADETAAASKKAAVNAEESAKKAADNVGTATKEAADATAAASKKAAADAAAASKDAGKNITAVTEVGPKVKLAIDADKDLNDTHNDISVQPKDGVVHLVGHVYNASMKKKATADATKALKDLGATDTLSNELTVSGQ